MRKTKRRIVRRRMWVVCVMKVERDVIDYEPVYGVVIKMTDKEAEFLANFFESHEFPTYAQRIRNAVQKSKL